MLLLHSRSLAFQFVHFILSQFQYSTETLVIDNLFLIYAVQFVKELIFQGCWNTGKATVNVSDKGVRPDVGLLNAADTFQSHLLEVTLLYRFYSFCPDRYYVKSSIGTLEGHIARRSCLTSSRTCR